MQAESVQFSNISSTPSKFTLRGGMYALMTVATGSGTLGLEALGFDNATWINVGAQITDNTGYQTLGLPPGTYQFVISGFTGVYATITRLPT